MKSFTVAYTISYFHYLTDNRLDLWKIYEEQKTNEILNNCFKNLLIFVYEHLVKEASNSLISEYAKRETSWIKLKETAYKEDLQSYLQTFLISKQEVEDREIEKEIEATTEEDRILIISKIYQLGLKFWDGFRKYLDINKKEGYEYMMADEVFSKMKHRKNISSRDISFGKKVLLLLENENGIIDEAIKLSMLVDSETIELKYIFDKLNLISKNEWTRIIDLASETKIFDNLELSNIKTIHTSLLKKDKIKEQALIQAYESLKKLKRFGINV